MRKFLMLAGIALLGGLTPAWAAGGANGATAVGGRSAVWKQSVALAASDPTQAAEALKRLSLTSDGDRAAFVADVLFLVQSKPLIDAGELNRNLAAVAGALAVAADAGGYGKVVLQAIANFVVGTGVTGDQLQVSPATLRLIRLVMAQLPGQDRTQFAADVIGQVDSHQMDSKPRAMGALAVALVAGAGDQKSAVIVEVIAMAPMADLPAVTSSLAAVFDQHKNQLTNELFLQVATKILDVVAGRLSGLTDKQERYAYALDAFISASASPVDFKAILIASLSAETLGKVGGTKDSVGADVQGVQAAVTAVQAAVPAGAEGVLVGDPITTTGQRQNVTVEQGPAYTHENRPPPGYQNQGIF